MFACDIRPSFAAAAAAARSFCSHGKIVGGASFEALVLFTAALIGKQKPKAYLACKESERENHTNQHNALVFDGSE